MCIRDSKGSQTQQSAAESRKRRVAKSKESELESQTEEDQSEDDSEIIAEAVEVSSTKQEETTEESDVESKDSPYGEGSAFALEDGSAPSSDFVIKAKVSTKIYHPEESSFFGRTKADVWFTNAEAAEAAGFRLPNSMQNDDAESKADQNDNDGENE